jgi:tetratricopeptide (TPR) repeat protein
MRASIRPGTGHLLVLRQVPGSEWVESCRALLEPAVEGCINSASGRNDPGRAAFWAYNYAQFLYGKHVRDDARKWVVRAIELDPGGYGARPEPQRLLGGIAWFAADMPGAVKAYQAAVEKGGLKAAGSQLADSLMYAGRFTEARDVLRQVLDSNSDNWRDWFIEAILDELIVHLDLPHQVRRNFPPEGTVLSGRSKDQLEKYLIEGDALNQYVWLARCLQHPIERLTTLMTGAFLSSHPFLMAGAVEGMIYELHEAGSLDAASDNLARLLSDNPETRAVLLSDEMPTEESVRKVLNELALRSLELMPAVPGVQLVDENNIVQTSTDPATHDE